MNVSVLVDTNPDAPTTFLTAMIGLEQSSQRTGEFCLLRRAVPESKRPPTDLCQAATATLTSDDVTRLTWQDQAVCGAGQTASSGRPSTARKVAVRNA